MGMSDARKKFQELLRELFQFDCADLDFGYRLWLKASSRMFTPVNV